MSISVNNRKLEPSLSALIHSETGEICRLGEFHFILLETLIANSDRVLSRNFLINEVWKNRVVGNNSLPTAIHALRLALGDDGKQQEIIKTVPKKGYIFSSDWVVELPDTPANEQETQAPFESKPESKPEFGAESELESASEPELKPESTSEPERVENASQREEAFAHVQKQPASIDSMATVAVSAHVEQASTPRRFAYTKPLALLLVLLCIIAAGAAFYMKGGERQASSAIENESRLIHEPTPETDSINVYHVYQTNANEQQSTTLVNHLPNALKQIDATLKQKNATMTLYYHTTLQRLAFDALLTNGCQHTYQLAINVDNWQGNNERLGDMLHQEVERTLNEMPACK